MILRAQPLGAAEHHVLEHVGKALPLGILVLRADVIPDLHIDDRAGEVLERDHAQAVVERDLAKVEEFLLGGGLGIGRWLDRGPLGIARGLRGRRILGPRKAGGPGRGQRGHYEKANPSLITHDVFLKRKRENRAIARRSLAVTPRDDQEGMPVEQDGMLAKGVARSCPNATRATKTGCPTRLAGHPVCYTAKFRQRISGRSPCDGIPYSRCGLV